MKTFGCFGVVRQTSQTMLGWALVLVFCAGGSAQAANAYPSYNTRPLPADISAHNPTSGEEAMVDDLFDRMKKQFVDKGVPVLLGEFGAIRRSQLTGDDLKLHLAAHAYYHKYVVSAALRNGMIPLYWDTGDVGPNSFGLFDRKNNTAVDQQTVNTMREGAYGL